MWRGASNTSSISSRPFYFILIMVVRLCPLYGHRATVASVLHVYHIALDSIRLIFYSANDLHLIVYFGGVNASRKIRAISSCTRVYCERSILFAQGKCMSETKYIAHVFFSSLLLTNVIQISKFEDIQFTCEQVFARRKSRTACAVVGIDSKDSVSHFGYTTRHI